MRQPVTTTHRRMDNLTPGQRVKAMRAVRRRDTFDELLLRRALWAAGARGWRCDVGRLPGRPDLAFGRQRVAVFVDGGFWHGHPSRFPRPGLNQYWLEKVRRNVDRDRRTDQVLAARGWTVIRLWDFEIRRSLAPSVQRVLVAIGFERDDTLIGTE